MFKDLSKNRIDNKKPRKEGLTYIIDKLSSLDKDTFEILSPEIDMVKIYNVFPLLMSESQLAKRISFYHDLDIPVSTGSTFAEYAIMNKSLDNFVKDVSKMGFDIIEIGESHVDLTLEQKEKIREMILSNNLEIHWKIGKKDPRHQLGVSTIITKIEEATKVGANKIILEANQGYNVGIYDENGLVKWTFIRALTAKFPPSTFIFEAPLESQQSALLAEFGERVNLSEIGIEFLASIESQRLGFLSKSSFSLTYLKPPDGGPALKFVYYIIKNKNPIDQTELINLSHMPRRTVQSALDELLSQGLISERSSLDDARKKVYYPIQSDWL